MRPRYMQSVDGKQVLCDPYGENHSKVIVLGEEWLPASAERVASLMNGAFEKGYQQAQAEIRRVLGVK